MSEFGIFNSENPKKLPLKKILEVAKHDELIDFILQYAKSDKKLTTLLKAKFARNLSFSPEDDRYKIILDNIIPPRVGKQAPTSSDIKLWIYVAEDFTDQAQDAIALSKYAEAWMILHAVLSKIDYLTTIFVLHDNKEISSIYQKAVSILSLLTNHVIPQPLKERIMNNLFDMVNKSYFHLKPETINIPFILITKFLPTAKKQLETIILQHLEIVDEEEKGHWLALWFLFQNNHNEKTINIPSYIINPPFFYTAGFLYAYGNKKKAISLLENHIISKPTDKSSMVRLLEFYLADGKSMPYLNLCAEQLLTKGEFYWLDCMKKIPETDISEEFLYSLEKRLLNKYYLNRKLLTEFYNIFKFWDGFLQYLKMQDDLDWVYLPIQRLHDVMPAEVERLFILKLDQFLNSHFGEFSQSKLNDVLKELHKKGLQSIVVKSKKWLWLNYPDRTKLLEIINSYI